MADLDNTIKGIEHCLARYVDGLCDDCNYMGAIDNSYMIPMKCKEIIMRDALELMKEQPKWILVKEGLPEVSEKDSYFGRHIIIWDGFNAPYPIRYVHRKIRGKVVERWQWEDGRIYNGRPVIAWMYMPKPPKDGEQE